MCYSPCTHVLENNACKDILYTIIHQDRKPTINKIGGGIIYLIKSDLPVNTIDKYSTVNKCFEILTTAIDLPNTKPIAIIAI